MAFEIRGTSLGVLSLSIRGSHNLGIQIGGPLVSQAPDYLLLPTPGQTQNGVSGICVVRSIGSRFGSHIECTLIMRTPKLLFVLEAPKRKHVPHKGHLGMINFCFWGFLEQIVENVPFLFVENRPHAFVHAVCPTTHERSHPQQNCMLSVIFHPKRGCPLY